ncbi:lysozyme, partial [Escherichia coli]|uniref:lysozyme n=1 Tax=Escherichia coli TaxID=562 RepID=UPI001F29348A
ATKYKVHTDIAGVSTVCEGITGPDVIKGKTYTRSECDALLAKHIQVAKRVVDSKIKVAVPDTFRASMYSFTFNVGGGAYSGSTMLKLTNQGRLREACEQLYRWTYYR